LFQDFVGYDEAVLPSEEFDPSTNYWEIAAYRRYRLDICHNNKVMTDSMSLRCYNTQWEIQNTVQLRWKWIFKDSLTIKLLDQQSRLWRDTSIENRPKLCFYN
jgi:hypothetical protein